MDHIVWFCYQFEVQSAPSYDSGRGLCTPSWLNLRHLFPYHLRGQIHHGGESNLVGAIGNSCDGNFLTSG